MEATKLSGRYWFKYVQLAKSYVAEALYVDPIASQGLVLHNVIFITDLTGIGSETRTLIHPVEKSMAGFRLASRACIACVMEKPTNALAG